MNIRPATATDLKIIAAWLKKEFNNSVAKHGFYNNIKLIEEGQKRGELTVAADDRDNSPIAFYLGTESSVEILEVKLDCRRKGIGRLLMEHVKKCAMDKGCLGISGFCSSKDSLPFWSEMRFEQVYNPNRIDEVAYPIRRKHQLPLNCKRYNITFKLYKDADGSNLRKAQVISAALYDQNYELEEDFVEYVYNSDTLLIIESANQTLYKDSIKYINDIGGERDVPWLRVNKIKIIER